MYRSTCNKEADLRETVESAVNTAIKQKIAGATETTTREETAETDSRNLITISSAREAEKAAETRATSNVTTAEKWDITRASAEQTQRKTIDWDRKLTSVFVQSQTKRMSNRTTRSCQRREQ